MRTLQELQDQVFEHEVLTGLVAPDGALYECADCSHYSVKQALFGRDYSNTQLENWLHVGIAIGCFTYHDGWENLNPRNTTWAQQKVLDAILASDMCDRELRRSIYQYLGE